MKKILLAGLMASGIAVVAPLPFHSGPDLYAPAMAEEQVDHMAQMRLTLRKLQDAMSSMKDFDELESAGMPKSNVDRMRSAMQLKINKMMNEVLEEIQKI